MVSASNSTTRLDVMDNVQGEILLGEPTVVTNGTRDHADMVENEG